MTFDVYYFACALSIQVRLSLGYDAFHVVWHPLVPNQRLRLSLTAVALGHTAIVWCTMLSRLQRCRGKAPPCAAPPPKSRAQDQTGGLRNALTLAAMHKALTLDPLPFQLAASLTACPKSCSSSR
jgi:hypothetical protein